jgi:hypothetical protein
VIALEKQSNAGQNLRFAPEPMPVAADPSKDTICPVNVRGSGDPWLSAVIHIVFVISGASALLYQ